MRPCRPERNLVLLRDHELHPRRVVSVQRLEMDLDNTVDIKLSGQTTTRSHTFKDLGKWIWLGRVLFPFFNFLGPYS